MPLLPPVLVRAKRDGFNSTATVAADAYVQSYGGLGALEEDEEDEEEDW
jgi:hypothetical protein